MTDDIGLAAIGEGQALGGGYGHDGVSKSDLAMVARFLVNFTLN